MIESSSKYKSILVYDMYRVCMHTPVLYLCDPKACPVNMLAMLIVDKWVLINIVYRRWICDSVI